MNIIIVGTGAVAAEITLFFPGIKGYLEYSLNVPRYYDKYKLRAPVLGDADNYRIQPSDRFVFAFADICFRTSMIDKLKDRGAKFINLTHPSALVSPDVVMGEGNVIYPNCIVSAGVKIGNFNLLTCQSILSHDCMIGSNNVLATALLCGHVHTGDNNSFGIRSTVTPHVNIGYNNTIQAGMTVDKDISNNEVVYHRFKEKLYFHKSCESQ